MSDSHTYQWLVIHNKESMTSLSLATLKDDLLATGKAGTDQGVIDIIAKVGPEASLTLTPLRVEKISSGNTKVAVSKLHWATVDDAVKWSTSADGKAFLRENHDAFLIAIPKAN